MVTKPEYKEAAERQHKIAEYFYTQLEGCYSPDQFINGGAIAIKTQAYFEGCIRAAYSCLDKLCDGTLQVKSAAEIKTKLEKYGLAQTATLSDFIYTLKDLRNDVTHNCTTKAPQGKGIFITLVCDQHDIKELAKKAVSLTEKAIGEACA